MKKIRETVIGADTITKNRQGNIVFRRSFFYRNGQSAEGFATGIVSQLTQAGINAVQVGCGEKWATFRGGSSVRQGSHWWVAIKLA